MYARAGQLGLPVSHMPFKGFLLHADEIEQLLVDYPGTKAIIDHCGFCNCGDLQSEEWQRLLSLAKYPQVRDQMPALVMLGCVITVALEVCSSWGRV